MYEALPVEGRILNDDDDDTAEDFLGRSWEKILHTGFNVDPELKERKSLIRYSDCLLGYTKQDIIEIVEDICGKEHEARNSGT